MKKAIQLAFAAIFFLSATTTAQTAKKPVWAELKAFHALMSTSFHPAEEGNFAPLKQKADSLFAAAKTWYASPIPDNYKPEETKATLKDLVYKTGALKKSVEAKATDEALLKLITEAHDVFHKIVGECRKED